MIVKHAPNFAHAISVNFPAFIVSPRNFGTKEFPLAARRDTENRCSRNSILGSDLLIGAVAFNCSYKHFFGLSICQSSSAIPFTQAGGSMQLFVGMIAESGIPTEMSWIDAKAIAAIVCGLHAVRPIPVAKNAHNMAGCGGASAELYLAVSLARLTEGPRQALTAREAHVVFEKCKRFAWFRPGAPRMSEMRRAADAWPDGDWFPRRLRPAAQAAANDNQRTHACASYGPGKPLKLERSTETRRSASASDMPQ